LRYADNSVMSDYAAAFATLSLDEMLTAME
jgi:hypothetical protein